MFHAIKHFKTITNHRHLVIAHCFRAGIGLQGLFHDLSNYLSVPTDCPQRDERLGWMADTQVFTQIGRAHV